MPKSTSLWTATSPRLTSGLLTRNESADVCVIGAGIAGLTTAYLLAREGCSVVVLDAGTIGGAATAMTSAHLSSVIDATFKQILRLHGPDGAKLAYESHSSAIDRIEAICQDEQMDCQFVRLDGYLFLGRGQKDAFLHAELEAAQAVGARADHCPKSPLHGFNTGPCLRFCGQGQLHPLKYLSGLAAALQRRGGRIYASTRATQAIGKRPAHVTTASGHKIKAGAIVLATNAPFNDPAAIHAKQTARETYVIGARVEPGAIAPALYWDTDDPYHYVRLHRTTDRELGGGSDEAVDILIVGGEDQAAGSAQDADSGYERLERWMRGHAPAAGAVAFRWSGQVLETIDGLAFIGRNPLDANNVYIVTGDCGMGLTHGTIAGMLITDLIQKRSNPWEELYDPARVRTGAAVEWVKENWGSIKPAG